MIDFMPLPRTLSRWHAVVVPWVWHAHLELLERTLYFFSTSAGTWSYGFLATTTTTAFLHLDFFISSHLDFSFCAELPRTWNFLCSPSLPGFISVALLYLDFSRRPFSALGFSYFCDASAHLDFNLGRASPHQDFSLSLFSAWIF